MKATIEFKSGKKVELTIEELAELLDRNPSVFRGGTFTNLTPIYDRGQRYPHQAPPTPMCGPNSDAIDRALRGGP